MYKHSKELNHGRNITRARALRVLLQVQRMFLLRLEILVRRSPYTFWSQQTCEPKYDFSDFWFRQSKIIYRQCYSFLINYPMSRNCTTMRVFVLAKSNFVAPASYQTGKLLIPVVRSSYMQPKQSSWLVIFLGEVSTFQN